MLCNFQPYEGKEKYIFVSYSHKDCDTVYPILDKLNEAGYRVWYDEGIESGEEFNEVIAEHIGDCEVFLAFHSQASRESEYCRCELNYAINTVKKRVVSVYLEDVELSPGMVMRMQSSYQELHWHQYKDKSEVLDKLINRTSVIASCRADMVTENPEPKSDEHIKASAPVSSGKWLEQIVKSGTELVDAYEKLGDECRSKGDTTKAREYYESSLAKSEELVNEVSEFRSRDQLLKLYRKQISFCYKVYWAFNDAKWLKKCVTALEKINSEEYKEEERRELTSRCLRLGSIYKLEGNVQEAREWYKKSVIYTDRALKQTGSISSQEDLGYSYYNLAMVDASNVDITLLKKAESVWMDCLGKRPKDDHYINERLKQVRDAIAKAESQQKK